MKNYFALSLAAFAVAFSSCGPNEKTADAGHEQKDSAAVFYLEDLLNVQSEAELKTKFPQSKVSYDTIWGSEGMFAMGSYLDKGTPDEVQIMWADSAGRSDASSVAINALYEAEPSKMYSNKWRSKTGLKLGMTSSELEKLNGKPFLFSGFGWDYGGSVVDWQHGDLDEKFLGVTLTEGDGNHLSEAEMDSVLGDRELKSDRAEVRKLEPKVAMISVFQAD